MVYFFNLLLFFFKKQIDDLRIERSMMNIYDVNYRKIQFPSKKKLEKTSKIDLLT